MIGHRLTRLRRNAAVQIQQPPRRLGLLDHAAGLRPGDEPQKRIAQRRRRDEDPPREVLVHGQLVHVQPRAFAHQRAGGDVPLLAERAHHGAEREVASKSTPTDLVSEADVASQRAIRELLAQRRPDDGFVGEEEEGTSEEGDSGLSWVVDPLDGTVNFLFGIPQWSVSVAVRDDAGTIAGCLLYTSDAADE